MRSLGSGVCQGVPLRTRCHLGAGLPGRYERRFLGRHRARCCGVTTQERIADETGWSPRQVRSAVADLREKKLIASDQTRIWLLA